MTVHSPRSFADFRERAGRFRAASVLDSTRRASPTFVPVGDLPMLLIKGGFRLLPPDAFVRTGPVDHGDWNYRFPLGAISRRRLALATKLLPPGIHRLLKIGYGSGVHMPHWATKAAELYGIDPHPHAEQIAEVLRAHGVAATLASGSAEAMPYSG